MKAEAAADCCCSCRARVAVVETDVDMWVCVADVCVVLEKAFVRWSPIGLRHMFSRFLLSSLRIVVMHSSLLDTASLR